MLLVFLYGVNFNIIVDFSIDFLTNTEPHIDTIIFVWFVTEVTRANWNANCVSGTRLGNIITSIHTDRRKDKFLHTPVSDHLALAIELIS